MGQLPDAALGVVRLSWSPLLPGSWFGGHWLPGMPAFWDSQCRRHSSPSQQALTDSFVLQSHCSPFSVSFLTNFTSTSMPLFCTSIFSRRSRILHQASRELRCLCATGPGHVCWWSWATYEASAASQLSFYSTSWQHWRASPLECLSPNYLQLPPASECSRGLFPFLSFIHSTNSHGAPRCARHGTKKEVLPPWSLHSVMDQAIGRI